MKEYNVMNEVLECLKDFEEPKYDINDIEYVFEKIKVNLGKYLIKVQKECYEFENYYIKFYFSVEKEEDAKRCLRLVTDVMVWLQGLSVRAYITEDYYVCFEVERPIKHVIGLKKLLMQPIENENKNGRYCVIGQTSSKTLYCDITNAPHLLILGGTGSGKTILVHDIIVSLVARYSPEQLKLVLIDPKAVEFKEYDGLPHLINGKPILKLDEIKSTLEDLINLMLSRYELCRKHGVKNIDEYNEHAKNNQMPLLAKIIVIIDEFSFMFTFDKKQFEALISQLVSKARSMGIHLILSTQMLTREVVSSMLRTNIPSRICFRVASNVDSRLAIDENGANNLLGRGDLLYKGLDTPYLVRALAGYIGTQEIKDVISVIKKKYGEN